MKLQIVISLILLAPAMPGKDRPRKNLFEKYSCVEVDRFAPAAGVNLPEAYQTAIIDDLLHNLQKSRRFKQAVRAGENRSDPSATCLRVTGVVTKYKAGSRALRYAVGFGAGATKVAAQIKYADAASGEVLLEGKASGSVYIGLFGGNSKGAANGLAKSVLKTVK